MTRTVDTERSARRSPDLTVGKHHWVLTIVDMMVILPEWGQYLYAASLYHFVTTSKGLII